MKSRFVVSLSIGLVMLAAPEVLCAAVRNGSFESWTLRGWDFQSDTGISPTEPFTRDAGLARTMSSWGDAYGASPEIIAADRGRFLALNTRANANFLGGNTYNFSVSQNITLNPGEVLSGFASFYNGDSQSNDSAWVRVIDSEGQLVASLWEATSGHAINLLALPPATTWTPWQWETSTPGGFTLQLGMTTSGANNEASFGFFDGITIAAQPIPVPEPSAMALGILGSFALIFLRRRRH